jgi:hypothetical protein
VCARSNEDTIVSLSLSLSLSLAGLFFFYQSPLSLSLVVHYLSPGLPRTRPFILSCAPLITSSVSPGRSERAPEYLRFIVLKRLVLRVHVQKCPVYP